MYLLWSVLLRFSCSFGFIWLTYQARYVRVWISLGRHKARCVAVRLLMPPVENRTYHFHGIRLSTCGPSPWSHEAFLPISPAPQAFTRGQLARSLGTSVPVFPQARGLRHGEDSPCARLSHAPTTTPHPPLPEASEFRWGRPYLLPTLLRILQEASRVPYGGLKQDDVGGALSTVPSALCGSPDVAWGRGRFAHALFHWAYGVTQCRAYCCRMYSFCWPGWHHRQGMPGS
jgi:hypothetical protein